MSEMKSQLELLKTAARGLETVSLSGDANAASDREDSAINALAGIGYGTLNVTEGTVTRFSQEALPDVEALTKSLRDNRAEYVRGVGFRVMRECVAKTVVGMFRGRSGDDVPVAVVNPVCLSRICPAVGAGPPVAAHVHEREPESVPLLIERARRPVGKSIVQQHGHDQGRLFHGVSRAAQV